MPHKLAARSKISHLPDDLRSIAEELLRKKFPEDIKVEPDVKDPLALTSEKLDKLFTQAREAQANPKSIVVSPQQYMQLRQGATNSSYTAYSDSGMATLYGLNLEVDATIGSDEAYIVPDRKDYFIEWPRNYGKTNFNQMYNGNWGIDLGESTDAYIGKFNGSIILDEYGE